MEEKFIDQVAIETEGYNIRDLEDFVTKKIFDAVKNASKYFLIYFNLE